MNEESFMDYSKTEIYQKLHAEVKNVAYNILELTTEEISEIDINNITQRICEERDEDSVDFWIYLSDIEELTDEDDWSDVNDCIENIIEKYMEERV
jgi:hypothetical protein